MLARSDVTLLAAEVFDSMTAAIDVVNESTELDDFAAIRGGSLAERTRLSSRQAGAWK